jgi:hypothetical protein
MSDPSIQQSVSPLRQRMLEDMAMRGLREEIRVEQGKGRKDRVSRTHRQSKGGVELYER